jgi:uncharacterized protein YggU (UPF0235/DUF167 family)
MTPSTDQRFIDEIITLPTLHIRVKTGAPRTEISEKLDDGSYKMSVASPPENGRANTEIWGYLLERTGKQYIIISGKTSRMKLLKQK